MERNRDLCRLEGDEGPVAVSGELRRQAASVCQVRGVPAVGIAAATRPAEPAASGERRSESPQLRLDGGSGARVQRAPQAITRRLACRARSPCRLDRPFELSLSGGLAARLDG